MDGQNFLRVIRDAFEPFLKEMGFSMEEPSISGRFYRASFSNSSNVVSVSYEPGDDAQFVLVFGLENGRLSDYDDRLKTPRLADLNNLYMHLVTAQDRTANEAVFDSVQVTGREEKLLLKNAKELRLVLPKYLKAVSRNP